MIGLTTNQQGFLTRLFEKLSFNQLYEYFNDKSNLLQEQFGFGAIHSTVSCI